MAEVIVYSSANCPYCDRAKQLLGRKQVSFVEYRVDQDPARLSEMLSLCEGRRSGPQIIINGQAIGGFDDMNALEQQGVLDNLLNSSDNEE